MLKNGSSKYLIGELMLFFGEKRKGYSISIKYDFCINYGLILK